MIKCPYTDCNYTVGWLYREGNAERAEPPEGEFYLVRSEYTTAIAFRFHGDKNEMALRGCPKCRRVFIDEPEEQYLDGNPSCKNS